MRVFNVIFNNELFDFLFRVFFDSELVGFFMNCFLEKICVFILIFILGYFFINNFNVKDFNFFNLKFGF